MKTKTKDHVKRVSEQGRAVYYAVVNGHSYGPWHVKEYAEAGLQTELRREAKRKR